jgi:uncharacterized membrane protein (DUF485 family)
MPDTPVQIKEQAKYKEFREQLSRLKLTLAVIYLCCLVLIATLILAVSIAVLRADRIASLEKQLEAAQRPITVEEVTP